MNEHVQIHSRAPPHIKKQGIRKSRRKVWQQESPQSWKKTAGKFIVSFLSQNCIHGLAYLVKKGLTLFERSFWFLLLLGSFAFCVLIGLQSIDRYNTRSTVAGVERDYYYWRTKTAGVTICPLKRLNVKLFERFCRQYNIGGQRKKEFFDFLENLANSTYTNFERIPEYNSTDSLLEELHVEPKDYMILIHNLTGDATLSKDPTSRISARVDNVKLHVRQVLTEWGLCYNANTILGLEYTAHYMLYGQIPEEYKNTKVSYTAPEGSFFDTDVSFEVFGFTSALDMFVHSAYEVLHIGRNYGFFSVALDVEVRTEETVTEEDLQEKTTVNQRQCRFSTESNLAHFPIYTKNLCMQECRLELAYRLCKCIPHFYPNLIKNPKSVCSYKQLKECFPDKKNHFIQIFRYQSEYDGFKCECLDNCRGANIYITNKFFLRTLDDFLGSFGVFIRIKKFPTLRLKLQNIYTFTDLLVSIGGTAGLFLGFSVLGVIEIFYHFSLRLFWFLRGYV